MHETRIYHADFLKGPREVPVRAGADQPLELACRVKRGGFAGRHGVEAGAEVRADRENGNDRDQRRDAARTPAAINLGDIIRARGIRGSGLLSSLLGTGCLGAVLSTVCPDGLQEVIKRLPLSVKVLSALLRGGFLSVFGAAGVRVTVRGSRIADFGLLGLRLRATGLLRLLRRLRRSGRFRTGSAHFRRFRLILT